MHDPSAPVATAILSTLALALGAAAGQAQTAADPGAANQALDARQGDLAAQARQGMSALDFDDFRDRVLWVEATGKYYVNGDVPIRNEKLLREFWQQNIQNDPLQIVPAQDGTIPEFAIATVGGLDQIWSQADRMRLTYCVSDRFGDRRQAEVARAMRDAARAWEAAAALGFIHVAAEDADCDATNDRVIFDVRPVDARGEFLAAAFFPNEPRRYRSLVIDPSAFALDPSDQLTLTGILRHELGHVIGARHEHTRPEAGACFEDAEWRAVTDYEPSSVMHYPQCNGRGDWSLQLTASDQSGVACVYGAAPGFSIDPAICTPAPTTRPAALHGFGPTAIAQDDMVSVTSMAVVPGTPLRVAMTGSGDPDLYVKFDGSALRGNYDCRPFEDGAEELCALSVPTGASIVDVSVHGYRAGQFQIQITAAQTP